MTKGKEVVEERQDPYGDAWYWHGRLYEVIPPELRRGILEDENHGFYFPWHLIFNKLLRALVTPRKEDHWLDIQGYAELARQHAKELNEQPK